MPKIKVDKVDVVSKQETVIVEPDSFGNIFPESTESFYGRQVSVSEYEISPKENTYLMEQDAVLQGTELETEPELDIQTLVAKDAALVE